MITRDFPKPDGKAEEERVDVEMVEIYYVGATKGLKDSVAAGFPDTYFVGRGREGAFFALLG